MFRFAGKESARTNRLTLMNGSFPLRSQRSHARVFGADQVRSYSLWSAIKCSLLKKNDVSIRLVSLYL